MNNDNFTEADIESVLHDILPLSTEHLKADDIANIASDLYLALTEPTRPTELQVLAKVSAYMDEAGGEGIDAVTDFLAERGVRVATEEQEPTAAEVQAAKAEAWDEGLDAGVTAMENGGPAEPNPYRYETGDRA